MFEQIVTTSIRHLCLGARDHAILNDRMRSDVAQALVRGDWTCHVCGIHLPMVLEVDHVSGHSTTCKDLRPICQFCHDREHILWAASRGRIVLIQAPDLTLPDISRLSWSLCTHLDREGFSIDRKRLLRDLNGRREDAAEAVGHGNIEAVLEAVTALCRKKGREEILPWIRQMDATLKPVPAILFETDIRIQAWTRGGFRTIDPKWGDAVIPDTFPGYRAISKAGEALRSKL